MSCGHSNTVQRMTDRFRSARWCVVWLAWLVSTGVWAQGEPSDALWKPLRVVADPGALWQPAQAWAMTQSPSAKRLSHPNQVLGPANSPPHWAGWTVLVDSADQEQWWLSLQSPTQDHSDVWIRRDGGDWVWQAGMDTQAQQGGEGHLFPLWVLERRGAKRLDVLLRTEGPNRVQFPLQLDTPATYMAQHQRLMLVMGAVLAVPLMVVFYGLSLVRSLRHLKLPVYLGMAFCELLAAAWVSGLLNLLWPSLTRIQAAWIGSLAYWLLFVISLHHAQSFLKTAQHHPRTHHVLQTAAWAWWWVVPACVVLSPEWLRALLLYGGSVHAAGMAILAGFHWRAQRTAAHALFTGVWLVYLSSIGVYWAYRWFEWALVITLGVQFVQGALVSALLGLSVCVQVISERRALRQSHSLSQARHRWYAAAHHDLWQPLQSIQLYANALVTAPANQQAGLITGMRLATASVDDFMNQLRDWSSEKAENGPAPPTVRMHLPDLLTPLVHEFRSLARLRHVVLRHRCASVQVWVHPPAVQRMVRNLLSNALQYTPAGGRVLLGVRRSGPWLWVLCWDNGIGMSPEQARVCFEAFTRADQHRENAQHLGLGLFSVRQLATQHQLPTRLQSWQGKGTVVGFGLPVAQALDTNR